MADVAPEDYQAFQELIGKDDKMPSRREILDMLETSNFTEDTKEKLKSLLIGEVPSVFGGGSLLAVLFAFIIFSIIFFFGYKLYKSIKEKERKREEKKKAKMIKKKK